MTEAYDWNPMPHRVSIRCPDCGALAEYEFAEVVRIRLAADVEYFQRSDAFEYQLFEDSNGSRWHGAVFYHGLRGSVSNAIRDLPEGYSPEDWNHSPYLYRSHGLDIGSVTCPACGCRKRHSLSWPDEAYFQIAYKGKALWAFDRESTRVLLDYVRSDTRQRDRKWKAFLLHIPSHFLTKKARDEVSKKLGKLLLSAA
ncbi:MAG: hypothetical protein RLO02_03405 [Roseitalea porphyridii]